MTKSEMFDWLNEHAIELLVQREVRALETEGFQPIRSERAVRLAFQASRRSRDDTGAEPSRSDRASAGMNFERFINDAGSFITLAFAGSAFWHWMKKSDKVPSRQTLRTIDQMLTPLSWMIAGAMLAASEQSLRDHLSVIGIVLWVAQVIGWQLEKGK